MENRMSARNFKQPYRDFSPSDSFTKPTHNNSFEQFHEIKNLIRKIQRKSKDCEIIY